MGRTAIGTTLATAIACSMPAICVLTRTAVHCNALGCLVYVEGPSTWPGKFARLTAQIRSDPDIAELNRQGTWPGAGTWNHGVDHAAMIVMPRLR